VLHPPCICAASKDALLRFEWRILTILCRGDEEAQGNDPYAQDCREGLNY